MLLADSVILIVAGLILVGIIGFFFMTAALVVRFLKFAFRALAGTPDCRAQAELRVDEGRVVCPHARCAHANRSSARYCARCGRPLGRHEDVDAYG